VEVTHEVFFNIIYNFFATSATQKTGLPMNVQSITKEQSLFVFF
jgi:hypothetical protein